MELEKLAEVLRYTKPSKVARPRGYKLRLEMWESIILEIAKEINEYIVLESFLDICGFYED